MSSLELGLIGNCQIAVLIDARGRCVWGSFPRFDSDPFFCSLLKSDEETGQVGYPATVPRTLVMIAFIAEKRSHV